MTTETNPGFLSLFFQSCERFPDDPAIVFSDRMVTYGEFAGLVQGIREHIETIVLPSDRRIAVHATQDVHTYAAILAILATGRAYVPLNPHNPPERNGSCLTQADVGTLLRSREAPTLEAWLADTRSPINVIDVTAIPPRSSLLTIPSVRDTEMAYLLFTSGSTGSPKGVPIYHRNLDRFLSSLLRETGFEFSASDRFLQMFDLTFDLSIMSFAVPLAIGAACHVVPEDGPGFLSVAKTLQRGRVTVALMVPSVLSFLERYFGEIRLPDMRYSLFCGEALPVRLARGWRECVPHAHVFNVYGPTEATIFCSTYEMKAEAEASEQHQGIVSIGMPMPGTEFRVINEDLAPVASGEKGELVISGGQVTDQYWRNPEKTAAAFLSLADGRRGYRTGDVVFEAGGNYFYCGRADHQFKVDGYRVEAGEVEHHARMFAGVVDAALVGSTGQHGKTVLYLFVQVSGKTPESFQKDCRAHLAHKLPPYMVPHRIYGLAEFPLNQNGKIDRKALAARIAEGSVKDG
jgi:amino acid adenylation domain-containing protein